LYSPTLSKAAEHQVSINYIDYCTRALDNIETNYIVDKNSIQIDHNLITMHLLLEDNIFQTLFLEIYVLQNGIFRIKLKPGVVRFEVYHI
jgi:hypothetical protein